MAFCVYIFRILAPSQAFTFASTSSDFAATSHRSRYRIAEAVSLLLLYAEPSSYIYFTPSASSNYLRILHT